MISWNLWPAALINGLQERRRNFTEVANMLQARGLSIDQLTEALVENWKTSDGELKTKTAEKSIIRALRDPILQTSILLGLEMDQKAEKGELSDVVRQIVAKDDPLCNIDELLAKAALEQKGRDAIDRFHELDILKRNSLLRNLDSKSGNRVNMFADDLVAAVLVMAEMDLIKRKKLDPSKRPQETNQEIQQSKEKRNRKDHVDTKKLRDQALRCLKKYGITIKKIAEAAYKRQKKFNPKLTRAEAIEATKSLFEISDKGNPPARELFYAILLLTEIDQLIKHNRFSKSLMRRFEKDPKNAYSPLLYITDQSALMGDIARGHLGLSRQSQKSVLIPQNIANLLIGNAAHMIADQQRKKTEKNKRGKVQRILESVSKKGREFFGSISRNRRPNQIVR